MQIVTAWRNILLALRRFAPSIFLASLLWLSTANAADNSTFSVSLAGVHPVLWSDFDPLKKNMSACISDGKMNSPI